MYVYFNLQSTYVHCIKSIGEESDFQIMSSNIDNMKTKTKT